MSIETIDIDPGVFHVNDIRVQKLRTGKISAEAFARMLSPDDYFVLRGTTVYALPEYQYLAKNQPDIYQFLSDQEYQNIINGAIDDKLTSQQLIGLNDIRQQYKSCPVCRKKRFKSAVYRLAAKYIKNTIPQPVQSSYPQTTGHIPYLDVLDYTPHSSQQPKRIPCLDCVTKHVSQAYITGKEALLGYPEYFALAIGHLSEAIDECPPESKFLRQSLTLCIGMSNKTGTIWIPLGAILGLIGLSRAQMKATNGDGLQPNTTDSRYSLQLDLTGVDIQPIRLKLTKLILSLKDIQTKAQFRTSQQLHVQWLGYMATIAQQLTQVSLDAANVVRNLRIMFMATPHLIKDAQLSVADKLIPILLGSKRDCLA